MRIEVRAIRRHCGSHGTHDFVARQNIGAWIGGVVQLGWLPGGEAMLCILRGLASSMECRHGHAVHLNMVRMTIAALLIVAGDDVRTAFSDEAHQPSCGLVEIRLGQAVRMVIGFPSYHARVTVAEDMHLLDCQMLARALEFGGTHVPKLRLHFVRVHLWIYHFALFPTRGGDQHRSYPLMCIACQYTARAHTLIVGMGMHCHQSQPFSHYPRSSRCPPWATRSTSRCRPSQELTIVCIADTG